jgi:hypothetical protein
VPISGKIQFHKRRGLPFLKMGVVGEEIVEAFGCIRGG